MRKFIGIFCLFFLTASAPALAATPQRAKAKEVYDKGVYSGMHGNYAEAVKNFKSATEIDPSFAPAYNGWGLSLSNMGKPQEALDKFKRATQLDGRLTKAWFNWGGALLALKRPAEAAQKFKKATQLDPKLAPAYNNWGFALVDLGKYDEAILRFRQAARLDPKSAKDLNSTIEKVNKLKASRKTPLRRH